MNFRDYPLLNIISFERMLRDLLPVGVFPLGFFHFLPVASSTDTYEKIPRPGIWGSSKVHDYGFLFSVTFREFVHLGEALDNRHIIQFVCEYGANSSIRPVI